MAYSDAWVGFLFFFFCNLRFKSLILTDCGAKASVSDLISLGRQFWAIVWIDLLDGWINLPGEWINLLLLFTSLFWTFTRNGKNHLEQQKKKKKKKKSKPVAVWSLPFVISCYSRHRQYNVDHVSKEQKCIHSLYKVSRKESDFTRYPIFFLVTVQP